MKGMVFTNFLKMVEDTFGMDCVDEIIERSNLPSGGVYSAVGTYPHTEIVSLVQSLSDVSNTPIPELLTAYGRYLFGCLAKAYPAMLEGCDSSFDLLNQLDSVIHVEVAKLYPDAELPHFETNQLSEKQLEMIYSSARHMEDLAEGLLEGCMAHFGNAEATIERSELSDERIRFLITI